MHMHAFIHKTTNEIHMAFKYKQIRDVQLQENSSAAY